MIKNIIIFLELFIIIGLLFSKYWYITPILAIKAHWFTNKAKFKIWLKKTKLYKFFVKEKYNTQMNSIVIEERKTSKEWFDLIPQGWEFDLLDKRGWDSPLIETFYQQTITKKEFIEKAKASHYVFNPAMNTDHFENGDW